MASTTTRVNQQQFAAAFGVDRTTVRGWTQQGLPYLSGGRGKPADFLTPLASAWVIGFRVSRDYRLQGRLRNLSGPVDPVALFVATSEEADAPPLETLADLLAECGHRVRDHLIERVGYFRALLPDRS